MVNNTLGAREFTDPSSENWSLTDLHTALRFTLAIFASNR